MLFSCVAQSVGCSSTVLVYYCTGGRHRLCVRPPKYRVCQKKERHFENTYKI